MKFSPPLLGGELLRRYKRFLADVRLPDGQEITAHCPNPGAMLGCAGPGWAVGLSHSADPRRKLPYTLEMVNNGETWIGVNTHRANQIVAEALAQNKIPELAGYARIQPEVRYGDKSRVDFLLSERQGDEHSASEAVPAYVEVKSVTLRLNDSCAFPDSVTLRGRRHLEELVAVKAAGARAVMLFVVQRCDGLDFRPAYEYDPEYAKALAAAHVQGVEILVYRASLNREHWELQSPLAWKL